MVFYSLLVESVFVTSEERGLLVCDTVQSDSCLPPVLLFPYLTWWQSINFTTANFYCFIPFLVTVRVGMMGSFTFLASSPCNVSPFEPLFLSESCSSETSAPVYRPRLCRSPGESHGQWASCQLNTYLRFGNELVCSSREWKRICALCRCCCQQRFERRI